jgi:hypothetical protein
MRISTMQLLDPKVTNSLWVLTPASTRRHTRHLSLQARCQLGVHRADHTQERLLRNDDRQQDEAHECHSLASDTPTGFKSTPNKDGAGAAPGRCVFEVTHPA